MRKVYNSAYSYHILQFIELKRKLGYKFGTGEVLLKQIDELAEKRGEKEEGITREFASKWCELRPNETERSRYNRIGILAQFSSYLIEIDINSFIPKLPPHPKGTFIPHIYSTGEINAIFEASDNLKQQVVDSDSCVISIPTIVRFLYGTGMRIGEVLALRKEDVDIDEKCVRVGDSKNGKERIIPISDSLADVCRSYTESNYAMHLGRKEQFFFTKLNGKKIRIQSVGNWFRKTLAIANIPYVGRHAGPRVHDLRHTFAVHALANMVESGVDLYASLPILSNYMGHQSIGATEHYVRLTSNMYPGLVKDVDKLCLNVFPKFSDYEAD